MDQWHYYTDRWGIFSKIDFMQLIIVGAGSFGREVYTWLLDTIDKKRNYEIKGFIDNHSDNQKILRQKKYPIKLIGNINDYRPKPNERLIVSIADTNIRKKIVTIMLKRGAKFYTVIHPSTIIGKNVAIGQGCIICPNCILANDSKIGNYTIVNTSSNIGHDLRVGNFNSIQPMTAIMGNSKIDAGCAIGSNVTIIPKITVGKNAIIGSGSVVIRNVKKNTSIFGNPAKKIDK